MSEQVNKFIELAKQLIATGEVFIKTTEEIVVIMDEIEKNEEMFKEIKEDPETKIIADKLEEVQLKLINTIL